MPRLLQRDAKRLRRAVHAVGLAEGGADERNVALHEARKKAKRLRYAAESAVPLLGKRAKRVAVSVKKVQQALGAHQDTVMSRRVLRDYGVRAHLSGENGFTFGRLHALEQARATSAVQRVRDRVGRRSPEEPAALAGRVAASRTSGGTPLPEAADPEPRYDCLRHGPVTANVVPGRRR